MRHNTRSIHLTVCILLILLTLVTRKEVTSQSEAPEQLNILFISIDDLNDWVGFLGGTENVHTPNIDRLAGSSMVFTNAHTASPACAPSRTALMTGVHPARSGIMKNTWFDGNHWRNRDALREVETLSQFFGNRGYKTLGGGKIWHTLAPPWRTLSQIEPESWDYYYPSKHINIPYQVRAPEEVIYPDHFEGDRPHSWFTWGPVDVGETKMADYHVVEWARYELAQKHEKPLFMAVGLFRPHMPWEVPRKYFDMYPLDEVTLPEHRKQDLKDTLDHGRRHWHKFVLRNEQWKQVVQAYKASITFADAQVGRLLDALEESPHAEKTIVVLWSDHGMHIGEKQNWEKFTLWEESTRVPLLFKVPGVTQSGSRSNQPVSLLDIYPTLADAAGFQPPEHLDGESLIPLMNNPGMKSDPVTTSFRFHLKVDGKTLVGHAVRSQRYRYIYYPGLGLEELYDHKTDPNEFENVAYREGNQDIIEQHRQKLLELMPDLEWTGEVPDGYELTKNGIRNTNFVPMIKLLDEE